MTAAEAKVEKAEEPKAKFEVVKPLRHKGKDYEPGGGIMLTEPEAVLLTRDGLVKVASKAAG